VKYRDEFENDDLIVGGGPAGLATAIKLKQLVSFYK
jgi:flavin-dependent dehydrogenase